MHRQKISKKIEVSINEIVISKKSPDQPLTQSEKESLNRIYNDALLRLTKTINLLKKSESYLLLASKNDEKVLTIQKFLMKNPGDQEIKNVLENLRIHFYINFNKHSISQLLDAIHTVKENLILTHYGLQGKLYFDVKIFHDQLDLQTCQNFVIPTYVLVKTANSYTLAYYEHGNKVKDININELQLSELILKKAHQTIYLSRVLLKPLTRALYLYHADNNEVTHGNIYI